MGFKSAVKKGLDYFGIKVARGSLLRNRTKRSNRLKLYDTATGKYYLPADARGDHIARTIRAGAVFEEQIVAIAKAHIRPGTIALDVGANFGQMAVLMSAFVGASGKVCAFEADDFVYSILEKNAQLNCSNIEPVFGAVHTRSNETLYFPVQDFERFQTYGSYGIDYVHGRGRPVKTVAIDDMAFDTPISFMKVDIQGGDLFDEGRREDDRQAPDADHFRIRVSVRRGAEAQLSGVRRFRARHRLQVR